MWRKAGWLKSGCVHLTEALAARGGFDALVLDLQHGHATLEGAGAQLAAIARHGCAAGVRLASGSPAEVGRALDLGAEILICPMVNTAAQAAAFAAAARYPPHGSRSWGPLCAAADRRPCVLPMVETVQALRNVEAILAAPGVDGVFVGPADLALSRGGTPADAPGSLPTLGAVTAAAAAGGKVAAVYCGDAAMAAEALRRGFSLAPFGCDLEYAVAGARL